MTAPTGEGVEERTCNGCGEVKPLNGFARASRMKGGYRTKCKACEFAMHKKRMAVNDSTVAYKHPLYDLWRSMRDRCFIPTSRNYRYYGARGITICPEWDHFWTFVFDMGPRPEGRTLDRIDNNGPYAPWNCRWATRFEQMENTRTIRKFNLNGEVVTLKALSQRFGRPRNTIRARIEARGFEAAIASLREDRNE